MFMFQINELHIYFYVRSSVKLFLCYNYVRAILANIINYIIVSNTMRNIRIHFDKSSWHTYFKS